MGSNRGKLTKLVDTESEDRGKYSPDVSSKQPNMGFKTHPFLNIQFSGDKNELRQATSPRGNLDGLETDR